MKYVRTKDEIYDAEKYDGDYYFDREMDKIVKEADDFIDLIDDMVFFDGKKVPHFRSQQTGDAWFTCAIIYKDTVRLGIYTDKGFIYVGKLNEKGKPVLFDERERRT